MTDQPDSRNAAHQRVERYIQALDNQIESLKTTYNMFFSGEIKRPPEKERETLEKAIQKMLQNPPAQSPKLSLLMQNLSSKFSLFNNMWAKRLNEIETGMVPPTQQKRSPSSPPPPLPEMDQIDSSDLSTTVNLNLNNESSFEYFVKEFKKAVTREGIDQDKIVNDLKLKMISENMISAKASLTVQDGKVKIKIKRSP